MKLIINEKNKEIADSLQDSTSMNTIIKYMQMPSEEGIEYIVVVQPVYDISEIVSPLMIPIDDDDSKLGEFIDPQEQITFAEYMEKMLKEGVIRLVVSPGVKQHMDINIQQFVDETTDYNEDDAVTCIMLPPIYWIKLTGNKWE
jgi:hypothetical protein